MRLACGLALMLVGLGACGNDDSADQRTQTRSDDTPNDVRFSGKLSRAAVSAGERTVEAVVIENCLSTQFASYSAAAPPCRPVGRVGVLPELEVQGGQTVRITTGAEAGSVFVRVADTRGDPAARVFLRANAETQDDKRQLWTVDLPRDVAGANRMDITVSPTATDSGQVTLAIRLATP